MNYWADFLQTGCGVAYLEGIKYVNLIEIGPVEIRGVELAVSVINTLVHHTAFLAADIQPCVLISQVNNLCQLITSTN